MRMLELFAGSKRLARTFEAGGWEADTVELKDGQDVLTWEPKQTYEYVHSAPPCEEYSGLAYNYARIRDADRALWLRALQIVSKARAKFWTIENVKMAQWVWGRAPFHYGPYFVWGWYPLPQINTGPLWSTSFKGTHYDRATGRRWSDPVTKEYRQTYPQEFCDALYQTIQSGFDLQPVNVFAVKPEEWVEQ